MLLCFNGQMNNRITGFYVPDMLLLVAMQGLTGELEIESGNNIGSMLFYQGRILHALSPYSRAIGDLLVEDGLVTETELIDMLKLQKTQNHTPLGCLFLHSGKVSFEIIEMMVHAQIREAVKEFLSWERLSFGFVKKEIQPYDKINMVVHEFISPSVIESAKLHLCDIAPGQPSPSSTNSSGTLNAI
jgi:hypothetical protein